MKANLIFLNEEELDKSIYRVFSFTRLKDILNEKKLTLVKPQKWDDPFENFILKSTGIRSDGRKFQIEDRNNFYGQCWSLLRESDAMWRIYSPPKEEEINGEKCKVYDGVKVKTTIRKLFTPLYQVGGNYQKSDGTSYNLSSFVGKVKYKNEKKLVEMLNNESKMLSTLLDQSGKGQASTFFLKRVAFKHEREIRLIYNSPENNSSDYFKFDIDPNNLFDEIVFDPRMTQERFKELKALVEQQGFKNKIIQSGLYTLKSFTIPLRTL